MIKFEECRVDPKSSKLIIDVSVHNLSYYENVYIKKLYVLTQDTINSIDPLAYLDKAVYTSQDYNAKNVRLEIDGLDRTDGSLEHLDMSHTLFFVIVECTGTPSVDTPCGLDNKHSIAVTTDLCPIYSKILPQIIELGDTCKVPQNLINNFLQFKAFQIAVETEHYQEAINVYKKYFIGGTNGTTVNCGCYGGYSL